MAVTVKYFTGLLQPISESESAMATEFIKQTLVNDKVKIEEVFVEQKPEHINYYLDHNEGQNLIRQQYAGYPVSFYKNETVKGQYKKYDKETYNTGNDLTEKHVEVYTDGSPYPVYYKALDPLTGRLLYCEKSYYDEQNKITYEFIYDNVTGNFKELTVFDPDNVVDTDHHTILPGEIGVGNNPYDFTWEGFEYYKNAAPLPL